MKKLLLGILVLSSFAMADGKLFDFGNVKPVTGKVEVETGASSTINIKNSSTDLQIGGVVKVDTKIYDFVTLSGQVSTGAYITGVESVNDVLYRGKTEYLKLGLDFKKYGTPYVKLDSDTKRFELIKLGYENKVRVYGIGIEGESSLTFNDYSTNTNGLDFENRLKLDYNVLEGLNVYTTALLDLNRGVKQDENTDNNKSYIGIKGGVELGAKLNKFSIENDLRVKYEYSNGYIAEAIPTHSIVATNNFEYKLDDKFLGVDKLTVKPKLFTDLRFELGKDTENKEVEDKENKTRLQLIDLNINPSVEVNYEVAKNLTLIGNLELKGKYTNIFLKQEKNAAEVETTGEQTKAPTNRVISNITPAISLGLKYTF